MDLNKDGRLNLDMQIGLLFTSKLANKINLPLNNIP